MIDHQRFFCAFWRSVRATPKRAKESQFASCICLPLILAGCLHGGVRRDFERLETDLKRQPTAEEDRSPAAGVDIPGDLDRRLAGTLDLETLIAAALARNPEVREKAARAQADLEEVGRAGALDDPKVRYEAWAVPLRRPLAFDRAQMHMAGLMQDFPFPGNLGLRAEAALRGAQAAGQTVRQREQELIQEVRRSYYEYFVLSRELDVHFEHVRILEEFERITGTRLRTGAAPQQDLLKAQVELVILHNEVLFIEQRLGSVRAAINVLINRPDDAALGRPGEVEVGGEPPGLSELQAQALEVRPEIQAARLRSQASQIGLKLARREAWLPDFSVGIDYWGQTGMPSAWGGTFSLNLPWLTGKRFAEARRMERAAGADEIAIESARNRILYEVRDAHLRVEAARRSAVLFRGELLPKSRQAMDAARAGYENGKSTFLDLLEAERALRDIQIQYYRALGQYESARADLGRAAGTEPRTEP